MFEQSEEKNKKNCVDVTIKHKRSLLDMNLKLFLFSDKITVILLESEVQNLRTVSEVVPLNMSERSGLGKELRALSVHNWIMKRMFSI